MQKMEVMEQSCQQICQELVEMAKNKRMMTDNITVILVALNRGIETEENTLATKTNEYMVSNI